MELPIQVPTSDDFSMDFNFEVAEDVGLDIEDVSRDEAIGSFQTARDQSKCKLERHMAMFPVAIEVFRLLHDQGDWATLHSTILSHSHLLSSWELLEQHIVKLMAAIARAYYKDENENGIPPNGALSTDDEIASIVEYWATIIKLIHWVDLNDEQILMTVLMLRLRYFEHETEEHLELAAFNIMSTFQSSDPDTVLSKWVSHLLQHENYWAAEQVLEVCFRNIERRHSYVAYGQVWRDIKWFTSRPEASDDEQRLLAKIAIIQTFQEGFLRREASKLSKVVSWSTQYGWNTLVQVRSQLELSITWTGSRAYLRQELLRIDRDLFDLSLIETSVPEITLARDHIDSELSGLGMQAEEHHDMRLIAGIRWRRDYIANDRRLVEKLPAQARMAMPMDAYANYRSRIEGQAPPMLPAPEESEDDFEMYEEQ